MTDVRALKTVKTEACLLFCRLLRNRKFQGGEESSQSEALVRNSDPPEPSKTDRNKPRKLGNKVHEFRPKLDQIECLIALILEI